MTLGTHTDHTARNASLDANYGVSKATNWPASFNLRLYPAGQDPAQGGTELAATGGYAPLSIANSGTNFGAAAASVKANAVAFTMATSTGAWAAAAAYWALESGGVIYDSGQITDPTTGVPTTITVAAANVAVRFGVGKLTISIPVP